MELSFDVVLIRRAQVSALIIKKHGAQVNTHDPIVDPMLIKGDAQVQCGQKVDGDGTIQGTGAGLLCGS